MESTVIDEIIAERRRLAELGLPPRDQRMRSSDFPKAAAVFALAAIDSFALSGWPEVFWPWPRARFKPGTTRENLMRAAAMILAAIERLDRLGDPR